MNTTEMLRDVQTRSLRTAIKDAMREAEADGSELRAATLRLLNCAILERDVVAHQKDECRGCEEQEIMAVIRAMVSQREASVREFEAEGQVDLAEQEREELDVLREFLPKRLPDADVDRAAKEVVMELGAACLKDMGRCVTELKSRFPNRIDSSVAKKAVKKLLL